VPQWMIPALVAFACWGVWAFLPKMTTRYLNPSSAVIYEALGGALVALAVLAFIGFRPEMHARGISLALLTGVLGLLGALAYLFAVRKGPVMLISTITALYPVLAVALAYVLLHEPVTWKQAAGIALALIAILLMTT
jgi:transporter family protein